MVPPGTTPHRRGSAGLAWCTYRIQLHAQFGFEAAASIVGYLAELGVSHLYCSPYLQAVPGSTHGYDVADPSRLNRELGGPAGHARMVGALRKAGLGQLLDIVPNHMAADPGSNPWWWDVLENGPASPFAAVFDIDWEAGEPFTVLVPILGDHYGRVVESGELTVSLANGRFALNYHDHCLPISPRTVVDLLARASRRAGSGPLADLADAFAGSPPARATDSESVRTRHERKEALADQLAGLWDAEPDVAGAIAAELEQLHRDPDRLDRLLHRQNYRLAYWRTASEEVDYRRFFNIESLVGVRVEDPEVFSATHRLVLDLVEDGTLEGLRVDHVDGLSDPAGYLTRLTKATSGVYTVVEKILERGEHLPGWPVAGTSGYDFLNRVNNLFVNGEAEAAFTSSYRAFSGEDASWEEVVHAAKLQVMGTELAAEVGRLVEILTQICDRHRRHRDHTRRELRTALEELVAHSGVYRTYVVPGMPASTEDRRRVQHAISAARTCHTEGDPELFDFLGHLALGEVEGKLEAELTRRLAQLTVPVMAKGVEDTAFYRYHRLISLNEVGGDPGTFGAPVASFHHDTADAAARWPAAMLTLSTHDTKRSADVRARLNVLSEIPEQWTRAVQAWSEDNSRHRAGDCPDANAEYLVYQTLVGAWPLDTDRAVAFMTKATKEAKVHTSWTEPHPDYDQAVESFVRRSLADQAFVADLQGFLSSTRLVERGRRNSLVQTALLLTCPGVADIYQGTECWDLSLVDPDNRRPVDFDRRREMMGSSTEPPADLADDHLGISKLRLVRRLLADRGAHPDRYANPDYEPLPVDGPAGEAVVAFRRRGLVVVAWCRSMPAGLDATVDLGAGSYQDLLTGGTAGRRSSVGELLWRWPVAVLVAEGP